MQQSKVNALKTIVNDEFCVDINNKTRSRDVVSAKKAFSLVLRDYKQPFSRIGRFLDKNHSTIVHYMDNIDHELKTDVEFRERVKRVGDRFKSVMAHDIPEEPVYKEEIEKYIGYADQNKALKQTIRKLKKTEKELVERLNKATRKDSRIKDLCDMLEQRIPIGKEEEFFNKINRMMNGAATKIYDGQQAVEPIFFQNVRT